MYKKIAKKFALITLLFLVILGGVSAPIESTIQVAQAAPWSAVSPKKTMEVTVDGNDGTKLNSCPTCFVAVKTLTIWNMLTAPLDTVLSLIPRILVFVIKWLVILLAKLYQGLMAPAPSSFIGRLNYLPQRLETKTVVDTISGEATTKTFQTSFVFWLWSTALYYANIMITLFLIWIAINIILEKKQYTSYQALIKLLGVALLVNFSLVICTMLVDLSNFIAVIFMSGLTGSSFSCLYACTIHKVANIFNCKSTSMIFSQTISNSLALMIGFIFVGQILGLIMYVLTRMIYLWFLVGVSPIALVLSAIPETKGVYKKWAELFQANLIKLPILAFASYFILNVMIYISNNYMLNSEATGENAWISTLGVVFILFILSQALLMVAQNLGVEQVSKASAWTNSMLKKGWDAVRKPVGRQLNRQFANSKPFKIISEKASKSRYATIASLGNKAKDKVKAEQTQIAADMKHLLDGKNFNALERLADSKDIFIKTQAMDYLAQLDKKGDYDAAEGKIKYTENNAKINEIKKAAKANKVLDDSAAYDSLKKALPHFKYGANPLVDGADIDKAVGEISALMSDPEKRRGINLRSTLEVLMRNSGDKLPELMQKLQLAITPEQLNAVSASLGNTPYIMLMNTLAKGIIAAKDMNNGTLASGQVAERLATYKGEDHADDIKNNLDTYAEQLVGGSEYNWFGKYGKKQKNQFDATARGRGYLKSLIPTNNVPTNNTPNATPGNQNNTQTTPPPQTGQPAGGATTTSPGANTSQGGTNTAPKTAKYFEVSMLNMNKHLDEIRNDIMKEIAKNKATNIGTVGGNQGFTAARIADLEDSIKTFNSRLAAINDEMKNTGWTNQQLVKSADELADKIKSLEQIISDLKNP